MSLLARVDAASKRRLFRLFAGYGLLQSHGRYEDELLESVPKKIAELYYLTQEFKILGSGSYGTVFRARKRSDNALVAVKELNGDVDSKELTNEVAMLWRLKHQAEGNDDGRFVLSYDTLFAEEPWTTKDSRDETNRNDPAFYLVTDYISDVNLRAWSRKFQESLSADQQDRMRLQAFEIARTAMRGLAFMHKASIVHRDLKPENIVLRNPESQTPESVLIDVGLACLIVPNSGRECVENPGDEKYHSIYGISDEYTRTASARSAYALEDPLELDDVWSMGVTLWEAFTRNNFARLLPIPFDTKQSIKDIFTNVDQAVAYNQKLLDSWNNPFFKTPDSSGSEVVDKMTAVVKLLQEILTINTARSAEFGPIGKKEKIFTLTKNAEGLVRKLESWQPLVLNPPVLPKPPDEQQPRVRQRSPVPVRSPSPEAQALDDDLLVPNVPLTKADLNLDLDKK